MLKLHIFLSLFKRCAQQLPVKVKLHTHETGDIDFQLLDEGDCACVICPEKRLWRTMNVHQENSEEAS